MSYTCRNRNIIHFILCHKQHRGDGFKRVEIEKLQFVKMRTNYFKCCAEYTYIGHILNSLTVINIDCTYCLLLFITRAGASPCTLLFLIYVIYYCIEYDTIEEGLEVYIIYYYRPILQSAVQAANFHKIMLQKLFYF